MREHYIKKEDQMSNGTPEQVLASMADGISKGDLDALMPLYESSAAFDSKPQ